MSAIAHIVQIPIDIHEVLKFNMRRTENTKFSTAKIFYFVKTKTNRSSLVEKM